MGGVPANTVPGEVLEGVRGVPANTVPGEILEGVRGVPANTVPGEVLEGVGGVPDPVVGQLQLVPQLFRQVLDTVLTTEKGLHRAIIHYIDNRYSF